MIELRFKKGDRIVCIDKKSKYYRESGIILRMSNGIFNKSIASWIVRLDILRERGGKIHAVSFSDNQLTHNVQYLREEKLNKLGIK